MWSTLSFSLLLGLLWLEVVVPLRVSFMGKIELLTHLQDLKPFMMNRTTVNREKI